MDVVGFVQEMLRNVAEYVASYRFGQSTLRQVDRVLWTVEKCARWAVPPPLDQDEHPQPELVRPLPWVFFLALLIVLRVMRESISLVNLVLGKPPLRSADVVTYIQGKRRYLRTLKYQGNRMMRARTTPAQPSQSWFSSLQSLLEFTMCFRGHTQNYGNNNTTRISNNEEVLVVKRNKRGRKEASPVASTSETSMERLIEKMMVDLQADSDDDSSYTLTNPMSVKSDQSQDGADSEIEAIQHNNSTPNNPFVSDQEGFKDSSQVVNLPPENDVDKINDEEYINENKAENSQSQAVKTEDIHESQTTGFEEKDIEKVDTISVANLEQSVEVANSTKDQTYRFLQSEKRTQNNKPKYSSKHKPGMANGRTVRSSPSKGKESSTGLAQRKA